MMKILFLCDGRAQCTQEEKTECFKNGGNCRHTSDIRHAKNFQCCHWMRVKELTAELGTVYVEKEPTAETEPQLDIEAVTTGETKAEREAFDFLRRRFNRKERDSEQETGQMGKYKAIPRDAARAAGQP